MSPDEYRAALKAVGISHQGAGYFFGVSERTAFRWVSDGPPGPVEKMLKLMLALNLSEADVYRILARGASNE